MPKDSRILNIQKWGQDASVVLTAVMENDDLVAIVDLGQINDQRQMVVAIEEFRKIMSQLAPVLEEGQNFKTMSNPLLTGTVPD